MATTVVVPVFNGFDDVARCLDALGRHTSRDDPILLLDDGSTDARIPPLLASFSAARPGTRHVVNSSNAGFVESANRAFLETDGDVVLLNSDCEVTAGWLEGLERCLASNHSIGIACPLSNNATLLSLPGVAELLLRDDGRADVEAIAQCVHEVASREYPRLPTAVGFCMLVARRVIEACGPMDRVYGRGYGEECDLSMRALDHGFEIACCDDVYVHHAGGASFASVEGIAGQREFNGRTLGRRWPRYAPSVSAWARANPLRPVAEAVNARAEKRRSPGKLRVLHVLHRLDTRGGIEEHTRALVNQLKGEVASTIAYPQSTGGAWADFLVERPGAHLRVARLNPDVATVDLRIIGHPASVRDPGVEAAFAGLLRGAYDVVHFHSAIGWNSVALPQLAARAGSAVLVTAHDFSMLCADYNMMLGTEERPCGRDAAHGSDAGCVSCLRGKSLSIASRDGPLSIAAYLEERYAASAESLEAADAVVCPSEFVARRMRKAFPTLRPERLRTLSHGVHDFPLMYAPSSSPVLRVAYLGSFTDRKGAAVLVEAMRKLAGERVVLEVWGPVKDSFIAPAREAGILLRGFYDPEALPRLLAGIDLVVQPSLAEESFCLTLSEAQRLGIPVVASAIGAIPERLRNGETGFLFRPGDVDTLVSLLRALRDDRTPLAAMAERLRQERPKTLADNAAEYLALYREIAASSRAPAPAATSAGARSLPSRPVRSCTPLGDDDYDAWLARESRRAPVAPVAPGPAIPLSVVVLEGPVGDFGRRTQDSLAAQGLAPAAITRVPSRGDSTDALRQLNRALAQSPGEWCVMVESGDQLEPDALAQIARAIEAAPSAEVFYCDDDLVSTRGERYDPAFKPRFSAELLRHQPYLTGLCVLRKQGVIANGGLDAPGWDGVVAHALRLAAEGRIENVRPIRAQLVHRLDLNRAAMESEPARESLRRAVARHSPPRASPPSPGKPFNVLLRGAASADQAAGCIAEIEVSAGHRIYEYFVELGPDECARISHALESRGLRVSLFSATQPGLSALAAALRRATCEWLALVDARCLRFHPGWIERAEAFLRTTGAGASGCDIKLLGGEVVPGWEVLGAGPWSIAGTPPAIEQNSAAADLYCTPREVSSVAPRLAFIRRAPALANVVLEDLQAAGRFDVTHVCLALAEGGHAVVAQPEVAAEFFGPVRVDEPAAPLSHDCRPPPEVAWMRQRWRDAFDDDRHFHPGLTLGGERLSPARRFDPDSTASALRICAFPFDRGGSGELRVRQPCAALQRSGRAQVLMMEDHDTGRAPNRLEWQRLGAGTLYAHNFFHDYQLLALDEYAQTSKALRVLGMDDLLTALPSQNAYASTVYRDIADRIARALSRSDRLVVSTAPLADAYGAHVKDVRIIPNALDESRWRGLVNAPRGGPRPRVGWAGAKQHAGDLKLLEPVLRATWRDIDWVFLGMCPHELRPMAAEVHDMVPVAEYPARLAGLGLDAAVAPLEDNPFNRAKSNLKLLEYGILGIPVIASDLLPYRSSPATLVVDAADWIDALRDAVKHRDTARKMGHLTQDWVLKTGILNGGILEAWSRALDPAG